MVVVIVITINKIITNKIITTKTITLFRACKCSLLCTKTNNISSSITTNSSNRTLCYHR